MFRQVAANHPEQGDSTHQVSQQTTVQLLQQQQEQLQQQLIHQQQQLNKQIQAQQQQLQQQLSQHHQITIQYGGGQEYDNVKSEDVNESKVLHSDQQEVDRLFIDQPPQQQPLNLATTSVHHPHTSTVSFSRCISLSFVVSMYCRSYLVIILTVLRFNKGSDIMPNALNIR